MRRLRQRRRVWSSKSANTYESWRTDKRKQTSRHTHKCHTQYMRLNWRLWTCHTHSFVVCCRCRRAASFINTTNFIYTQPRFVLMIIRNFSRMSYRTDTRIFPFSLSLTFLLCLAATTWFQFVLVVFVSECKCGIEFYVINGSKTAYTHQRFECLHSMKCMLGSCSCNSVYCDSER